MERPKTIQPCVFCFGTGGDQTNTLIVQRWKCGVGCGDADPASAAASAEMIDLIWERLNNLASSPCPCRSGEVTSPPTEFVGSTTTYAPSHVIWPRPRGHPPSPNDKVVINDGTPGCSRCGSTQGCQCL